MITYGAAALRTMRSGEERKSRREAGEPGDLELLAQVKKRNRGALKALYERYSSRVFGVAFKILRDRDLAEEIVGDTFLRVWQRADQFEAGRGSFSAWLYGIVRHLALDEIRRREARPIPHEDDVLELQMAQDVTRGEDLMDIVARRLDADAVHNALRALPPSQRQVIQMAYMEGLTRQEISRRTGQPLGTVHTRARLGLDKLRGMLSGTARA